MIRQFADLDRSLQLLMVNELVTSVSFYMLYPYLAVYFTRDLGMATAVVGLVLGIRALSQQGLTIFGGTLADRLGCKPVIVTGLLLRTVGFGLFAFVSSFPGVLVAAILSGVAGALFSPAARAYIATAGAEGRTAAFALQNVFGRVGMLLGPPLGVVLLMFDFPVMAIAAAAMFLGLTLLQLAFLPARSGAGAETMSVLGAWRDVFTNRPFILFSLAMLGSLTLFNQFYLGLPLEVTRVSGSPAGAGMLFTLSGVLTVVTQMPLIRFCQQRWSTSRSLAIGLVAMGLAFIPPMLTQGALPIETPWSALSLALNLLPVTVSGTLLTIGLTITNPFSNNLIPVLGRERFVGTYFGVYSMISGIATTATNTLFGAALDFGVRIDVPALPWLLMTMIGLASALAMHLLERRGVVPDMSRDVPAPAGA